MLFVDRGSTEIVPRQNIYSDLPEQVEGIPPQAYHCKLAGVKPVRINPFTTGAYM